MNRDARIAVTSRSFSRNTTLRSELCDCYAHVTFNEDGRRLDGDSLVAFLRGHDRAITALERIDATLLSQLPELQVISKYGVGIDMIDLGAMRRFGKRLGWTAGVNKRSVAELALSLIISMLRQVPAAHREVLSGTWKQRFGGLLSGKTVGIVGCGHVGKDLVRLLRPFGCHVLVHDIRRYDDFFAEYGIETVGLEALLAGADVVTLHVPLDDSTRGMLDARRINLLKPSALLINTARGGIVDEVALKRALIDGQLAGAAFDVFAEEPPKDDELLNLPSFFATPHIGGSAEEATLAMGRAAIAGLEDNAVPLAPGARGRWVQLSHVLSSGTPAYGGGAGPKIDLVRSIAAGDTCNSARLELSNHLGSHVDAPRHFVRDGRSVDRYSIGEWIFSRPQVLDVPAGEAEVLDVPRLESALAGCGDADLLLVRTGFEGRRAEEIYWAASPAFAPELAEYLIRRLPSLVAVGLDTISLTSYRHRELGRAAHRAFLGQGLRIFEDLALAGAPSGAALDLVVALPLLYEGADGAPCTLAGRIAE